MTGGKAARATTGGSAHCPGMTGEYRTEFTLWSLYRAHCWSTDVRNMTSIMSCCSRAHLVDSSRRASPGKRVGCSETTGCESDLFGFVCQLFARPLHDGTVLQRWHNAAATTKNLTLPFTKVGWTATTTATVEVYGELGNVTAPVVRSFSATVNAIHLCVYCTRLSDCEWGGKKTNDSTKRRKEKEKCKVSAVLRVAISSVKAFFVVFSTFKPS